jgi:hypothetical protein
VQRAQVAPRRDLKMHRISDVIEITRLSHSTIYSRIRDGSLKTVKVCGARLIPDDALRELLQVKEPGE